MATRAMPEVLPAHPLTHRFHPVFPATFAAPKTPCKEEFDLLMQCLSQEHPVACRPKYDALLDCLGERVAATMRDRSDDG